MNSSVNIDVEIEKGISYSKKRHKEQQEDQLIEVKTLVWWNT